MSFIETWSLPMSLLMRTAQYKFVILGFQDRLLELKILSRLFKKKLLKILTMKKKTKIWRLTLWFFKRKQVRMKTWTFSKVMRKQLMNVKILPWMLTLMIREEIDKIEGNQKKHEKRVNWTCCYKMVQSSWNYSTWKGLWSSNRYLVSWLHLCRTPRNDEGKRCYIHG